MKKEYIYPTKTVYYKSELDDFSTPNIKTRRIDENYKYRRNPFFFSLARFFLYRIIATPLASLFCKIKLGLKIKNRNKIYETEGEGCFIYANHTQQTADAYIPTLAFFPKSVYTVVHPDNVSLPVLGKITPYLGAIPIPSTHRIMREFTNTVESKLLSGSAVAIYPEAHIWPYYTKIRNFPDTSFTYPVRFNFPSYALTTTYKRSRFRKAPVAVTYIDGPFYPNMSLHARERAGELRNRIFDAMNKRAALSDCEYIRYEKREEQTEPVCASNGKETL